MSSYFYGKDVCLEDYVISTEAAFDNKKITDKFFELKKKYSEEYKVFKSLLKTARKTRDEKDIDNAKKSLDNLMDIVKEYRKEISSIDAGSASNILFGAVLTYLIYIVKGLPELLLNAIKRCILPTSKNNISIVIKKIKFIVNGIIEIKRIYDSTKANGGKLDTKELNLYRTKILKYIDSYIDTINGLKLQLELLCEGKDIEDINGSLLLDEVVSPEEYKELTLKYMKEDYELLVKILHGETIEKDPGELDKIYFIADHIGISHDTIDKCYINYGMKHGMKKSCKDVLPAIYGWIGSKEAYKKYKGQEAALDDYKEKVLKEISDHMPEFKTPDKSSVLLFNVEDKYFNVFIYSPKGNIFYYNSEDGYYNNYSETKGFYKSIFDIGDGRDISFEDEELEALKIADAELGYYKLSKPPKGVKPKKI